MKNIKHQPGYVLLISILLIGAIGVAIVVSILSLSSGTAQSEIYLEQSAGARALADACLEEGLEKIREGTSFSGSGSLSLGLGTCGYNVQSTGGQNRTITASSTLVNATRRVQATISAINPRIILTSWQEY
jgi:hypothetical protein